MTKGKTKRKPSKKVLDKLQRAEAGKMTLEIANKDIEKYLDKKSLSILFNECLKQIKDRDQETFKRSGGLGSPASKRLFNYR